MKPGRRRFDSGRVGPDTYDTMKASLSAIRAMVREALADHMRLPRGPNSRDDADDRPLDQKPETKKQNVEEKRA